VRLRYLIFAVMLTPTAVNAATAEIFIVATCLEYRDQAAKMIDDRVWRSSQRWFLHV